VSGILESSGVQLNFESGGPTGHAFSGRATRSGPLFADCVAYGCGRSFTVILRTVPASRSGKSVNGGVASALEC